MDGPPLLDGLLDDLAALGNVVVVGDRLTASGLDLLDDGIGSLLREVVDEDRGAARGEERRV